MRTQTGYSSDTIRHSSLLRFSPDKEAHTLPFIGFTVRDTVTLIVTSTTNEPGLRYTQSNRTRLAYDRSPVARCRVHVFTRAIEQFLVRVRLKRGLAGRHNPSPPPPGLGERTFDNGYNLGTFNRVSGTVKLGRSHGDRCEPRAASVHVTNTCTSRRFRDVHISRAFFSLTPDVGLSTYRASTRVLDYEERSKRKKPIRVKPGASFQFVFVFQPFKVSSRSF